MKGLEIGLQSVEMYSGVRLTPPIIDHKYYPSLFVVLAKPYITQLLEGAFDVFYRQVEIVGGNGKGKIIESSDVCVSAAY